MSDESSSRHAGGEIPEAELAVPASGERELAVGGEDDVLDKVGVAGETPLSYAVGLVVLGEFPDDDGFVAGSRDDGV